MTKFFFFERIKNDQVVNIYFIKKKTNMGLIL